MPLSYRFKHLEVLPESRQLLIDGKPAEVGSRAFDLLLLLIEHRNRVVGKQELMASLWPRMVVEENNLQIHVSALRKLVGATAIVTVQGRGYQFALEPAGEAPPVTCVLPPLPRLCGRDGELRQLAQVMQEYPLATVVGPGGVGKTSLALAAAHAHGAARAVGVVWVDLAGLPAGSDDAAVAAVIAHAAALPTPAGAVLATLAEALREREILLVLDNAEHVLAGVAGCVHSLVAAAPRLRMLVTSQAPLHLPDEFLFRLDGLSIAPDGSSVAEALQSGAIALFVERARARDRRFELCAANLPTVMAICRHLEGLPLALRLAASRLDVLGLDGIALHLRDSMHLLCGNGRHVADRQQTMQAALAWSYDLLQPAAQQLFCRLGVFVGGFWLEAAEALTAGPDDAWRVLAQLQELADHSMLQLEPAAAGQLRYRLPECARQYAWLRLEREDGLACWRQAHAVACLQLMEQAYEAYWRSDDASWLQRYAPDLDNVRHALDWVCASDAPLAMRIIGAASPLFMLVGMAPEARQRALAALHTAPADASWVARYWLERSRLEWGISSHDMQAYATRALALYDRLGHRQGSYLALRCAATARAAMGENVTAMLERMGTLELPAWGARVRSQRLLTQVAVCEANGDMAAARGALDRLLVLGRQAGLDGIACAALGGLAEWFLASHDYDAAIGQASLLLAQREQHRGNFLLLAHGVQASAHYLRGDSASGKAALTAFARAARQRNWEWLGKYSETLALCAALEGRGDAAARLIGFSDAARARLGPRDGAATLAIDRAATLCLQAVSAADLRRLGVEGATLDAAAAIRLALDSTHDGIEAHGADDQSGAAWCAPPPAMTLRVLALPPAPLPR